MVSCLGIMSCSFQGLWQPRLAVSLRGESLIVSVASQAGVMVAKWTLEVRRSWKGLRGIINCYWPCIINTLLKTADNFWIRFYWRSAWMEQGLYWLLQNSSWNAEMNYPRIRENQESRFSALAAAGSELRLRLPVPQAASNNFGRII